MTKLNFIKALSDGLKKMGTSDVEEIIKDYETHFDNELKKGKTEEEISRELGKISDILIDFQGDQVDIAPSKKLSLYSVIFADVFIYLGMLSLYLINLSVIILSLGSILLGVYFILSLNYLDFIPVMNPTFGLCLGLFFIVFAVLCFGVSALMFKFLNILMTRLNGWHQMVLKGNLSRSLISFTQSKLIKRITFWSGIVTLILLVTTYIIGVNIAENPQFWHEWNWFE